MARDAIPARSYSLNAKLFILILIFIGIYLILYLTGGRYFYRPLRPSWATVPLQIHDYEYTGQLPSEERLLPLAYWKHRKEYPDRYKQASCSVFPSPANIKYAATNWQYLPVTNGSVYLYAAYWDDRGEEAVVRVLIYSDITPLPELFCFLWYEEDNNPVTVPSSATYGWRPEWGGPKSGVNEPYIMSCTVRHSHLERPAAVSLASELCSHSTNALAVQGEPKSKGPRPSHTSTTLGICLKWLRYAEDISGPLTEWIEMLQVFGVDTIYIYVLKAHPNTEKVLQYYESKGIIQVQHYVHPPQLRADKYSPKVRNFHDYRQELLPLNDCLYRAVGSRELRWLGAFDLDEIIVPLRGETYQDVIRKEVAEAKTWPDALVFLNYYFLDGAQREKAAPPPARILAHVWRAREHNRPGANVKSFFSVNSVVAMHNHMPITCRNRKCNIRNVKEDVGRLYHYRKRCDGDKQNCTALHDVVRDDTMLKWSYVLPRITRVLVHLDIPFDNTYNDTALTVNSTESSRKT